MLKIDEQLFCESCFERTDGYPCPRCGFNGIDEKRDATALAAGTILQGRYIIGKMLGKGGFGITYLAYDYKNKCRVAVKEYFPTGIVYRQPGTAMIECNTEKENILLEGADKFYNEAMTVANLCENGNIVTVYEFFKENNTSYLVMEYLEGCDLKTFIQKEGVLSEGQTVNVISAVCNALGQAHGKDVLHRDVSPDNIFICNDGRIMLIDFGAARQLVAEKSQSMSIILKQGFAPFEQYQRKSHQGPWSDIYALGATVYYALFAQVPDDAATRVSDPRLNIPANRVLSDGLKSVLVKMMAVFSSERYGNTEELMADIRALNIQPLPLIIQKSAAPAAASPVLNVTHVSTAPRSVSFSTSQQMPNTAVTSQTVNTQPTPPPQKKKSSKAPFIIGGILLLLALLAVIVVLLFKSCDSSGSGGSGSSNGGYSDDENKDEETSQTADTNKETSADTTYIPIDTNESFEDKKTHVAISDMCVANNPSYGSVTSTASQALIGKAVKVKAVANTGYVFVSWDDGVTDLERTVVSTRDMVYTAIFEPKTVEVRFNSNGISPITVKYGEPYGVLPVPTAQANGLFAGWYDSQTGGNLITETTVVQKDATHTLYPRYSENAVASLMIMSTNHKTSYIVGEKINTSNLSVTAVYLDGTQKTITGFTTTPANGATVTESMNKITVSYEGKTVEYAISVTAESATKIEVVSKPSKLTYYEGDRLNTSGLSIKVTYSSGKVQTLTSGFATTPSNNAVLSRSNNIVTVSYGGKTTSFTITVNTVTLDSISVSSKPSKTTYNEGDKFSTAGLKIKLTYNNGSSEIISSGFTTNPANGASLTTSNRTVTVSYGGKTASFTITINSLTVTGLSVSSMPSKTVYVEGESFSTSGLKIKVTYNNGTSKTLSSGFTTSPANGATLSTSNTTVSVSYGGKTVTFKITISPKGNDSSVIASGSGYKLTSDGVLTILNDDSMVDYSETSMPEWYDYSYYITEIKIQNGVTYISNYAFFSCSEVQKVTIADSVKTIGVYAFGDCLELKNVNLGNGVTNISESAFESCMSLASITIPTSVQVIDDWAFFCCFSLTTVNIPSSVRDFGTGVFAFCESMTSITVDSSNKYYSSVDGVLFDKNKTVLIQYPLNKAGKTYTVPNTVEEIDCAAFAAAGNLESIVLQSGVFAIYADAFAYMPNLKTVTIPNTVIYIGIEAFAFMPNSITINYKGTQAQWNAIEKDPKWNLDSAGFNIKYS